MTKVIQEGRLYAVEEGDKVTITIGQDKVDYTIVASCGVSTGFWRCIDHDQAFQNNFAKDSHLGEPGPHTLAWVCLNHDLEAP